MSREEFLITLLSYANLPYIWGGAGPNGFDCSGLVQDVFHKLGLDPEGDQTADALLKHFIKNGTVIYTIGAQPDLGDLVFFGTPVKCTHVGIVLSPTLMFEAGGGDSTTTTPQAADQKNAKVRVSRIDRRKDQIAIIRPHGLPWHRPGASGPNTGVPTPS